MFRLRAEATTPEGDSLRTLALRDDIGYREHYAALAAWYDLWCLSSITGMEQMPSDQWLAQTGAELLAQVANVRPTFLVELDITDDQVQDLYHHIARSGTLWTPEARMCLAVAAVQAASHANQDEDSFRELFFDRLKRPFDQHEWENSYGPTIRYCLEQHFSVELPA